MGLLTCGSGDHRGGHPACGAYREQVVEDVPDTVPTIGELLDEWERARRDDADTAEVQYARERHPERISLDWMENAIDDEALYVISDFQPAHG